MKSKDEYFNELIDEASKIGLQLSEHRLVKLVDMDANDPLFIDYPAMWYYYCMAGMTAKEAILTEYPNVVI
ncbi:hypothetical protein VSS22_11205 [Klebsiella pneumoniae]|uniref:hypothetical protein n=1 Tax=Klebsiella pneumoniae TaxID=573 RepID=UPI002DB93CA2|nr:hypothetical protein [Klebsiella pneumoniae]MEC4492761.1 hypothetical protein [Klebsiella pneumoniae]HDO6812532.1 hypothetical protein [Klebsiella pneumoniae]